VCKFSANSLFFIHFILPTFPFLSSCTFRFFFLLPIFRHFLLLPYYVLFNIWISFCFCFFFFFTLPLFMRVKWLISKIALSDTRMKFGSNLFPIAFTGLSTKEINLRQTTKNYNKIVKSDLKKEMQKENEKEKRKYLPFPLVRMSCASSFRNPKRPCSFVRSCRK
jgi:hypothetical protein